MLQNGTEIYAIVNIVRGRGREGGNGGEKEEGVCISPQCASHYIILTILLHVSDLTVERRGGQAACLQDERLVRLEERRGERHSVAAFH